MVVRAGMYDSETVGPVGINIERRFTVIFGLAAIVAGMAGVMYTPILPPDHAHWNGLFSIVICSCCSWWNGIAGGAVLAGFILGILQSFCFHEPD